jgi:hypothetical protein
MTWISRAQARAVGVAGGPFHLAIFGCAIFFGQIGVARTRTGYSLRHRVSTPKVRRPVP